MVKEVILIADAASIFVNSVVDGLRQEGFECRILTTGKITAEKLSKKDTIEILWLNDELSTNFETMLFLRNLYSRQKKKLFLYGYQNQLSPVTEYMPEGLIGDVFERPITPHEIADRLLRILRGNPSISGSKDENRKRHILFVDDSGAMLRTVKGWLEPRYRVSIVSSATNAIAFLATQKPDLILLDYEMPICSGPQLMQMIRAEDNTKDIPIIFLTGKDDKDCVQNALSLSPEGYILKSMRPSTIVSRIDQFFLRS